MLYFVACIGGDRVDFKTIEQPSKVDVSESHTGHHAIPLDIIESVGIELACDNRFVDIFRLFPFQ